MHFAANGFLDDMLLGNQKNRNRKWKSWTTVLTTSQLLFFRGVSVMTHINTFAASGDSGVGIDLMAEPEDVVSLQDAFSVKEEGLNPVCLESYFQGCKSLILNVHTRTCFGSFLHRGINIFFKPIFPKTRTCG
jgi:hypothetical protein